MLSDSFALGLITGLKSSISPDQLDLSVITDKVLVLDISYQYSQLDFSRKSFTLSLPWISSTLFIGTLKP